MERTTISPSEIAQFVSGLSAAPRHRKTGLKQQLKFAQASTNRVRLVFSKQWWRTLRFEVRTLFRRQIQWPMRSR